MLNTDGQKTIVVNGLESYLKRTVVRTNTTAKIPAFPYLGFNITTLALETKVHTGSMRTEKLESLFCRFIALRPIPTNTMKL